MTFKELARNISALAGEEYTDRNISLISAVNRAQHTLYRDLSPTGVIRLYAAGTAPASRIKRLTHTGEGEHALSLTGKAYSMRLYGNGTYTHSEEGGYFKKVDFSASGERFAAFMPSGRATLTFSGGSAFTVTELVCYSEVYGERVSDIPDGSPCESFDIRRRARDFLAFVGAPKDSSGKTLTEAVLSDGTLTLPQGFSGEITLEYKRRPCTLTGEESELSVPEELLTPLATLAASYLLREDCPELSESLLKIYEADALAMRESYLKGESVYVETNGWA